MVDNKDWLPDSVWLRLRLASERIDELEAQNAAMVKALRPFAAIAKTWNRRDPLELIEGFYGRTTVELMVQHFLDAVTALTAMEER